MTTAPATSRWNRDCPKAHTSTPSPSTPPGAACTPSSNAATSPRRSGNEGITALLGIDGTDLMRRALATLKPEPAMVDAARAIRAAGLTTAVLSNSMGMHPFNPYEPWRLRATHDVVVLSEEVRMRKPDTEIYQLVLMRLGIRGEACIFVDDIEANLQPARDLGMTTILAADPNRTIEQLQQLLGLGELTRHSTASHT
ncbi:HAD-IA family hydrolase [Streptomyces sp. NPDC046862]|uniref:HAD-IA family hydrolase n=1 Tax=Streptomyces sp. NPDC046862 TaxID=3154603 RepID=UPI0034515E07